MGRDTWHSRLLSAFTAWIVTRYRFHGQAKSRDSENAAACNPAVIGGRSAEIPVRSNGPP